MDKTLTVFMWVWAVGVLLLNIFGIIGIFLATDTFWEGLTRVRDTYHPFNLINYSLNVALLLPALGAYSWRERRRRAS